MAKSPVAREQMNPTAVQISDGQVQVPIPKCTTCRTTLIRTNGGAVETVVLPAVNPSATQTTVPVNVNGQPRVAVVGPSGYVSFLPPDDLLIGGTVVTADPTGFKIGTHVLANGRDPVTVDGETVSYGSKGLFVDGMPKTFDASPAKPAETKSSGADASATQSLPSATQSAPTSSLTRNGSTHTEEQNLRTTESNQLATGAHITGSVMLPIPNGGTTARLTEPTDQRPAQTLVPTTTVARTTGGIGAGLHSTGATAAAQSSVLNATGSDAPLTTTLVYNGQSEVFVKATFSDLALLSTTTTVRTSISNHGSGWITAVPIVVLPHGIWWHGGMRGGGRGFCFWPFCPAGGPPGGGGDSSDADPEEDEDPEEEKNSKKSEARRTTAPPTSRPTSTSYSNLATISFEGDPIPDPLNAAEFEDWGSTVYNRLVAAGFGDDVSDISGFYTGATGTLISSFVTATSAEGSGHATRTTSGGGVLGLGADGRTATTLPSSTIVRQAPSTNSKNLPVTSKSLFKPLSDCALTTEVNEGTTNTILTVGTYIFCECGSIIAGTNRQLGTSGSTYVVCAGTPYPTVSTIVNVPTTAKAPTTTTAPAKPKASQAVIIYREDSCDELGCSSSAHVWAIYPGQLIDPCKNGTTDFLFHFPKSEANEESDYSIKMEKLERDLSGRLLDSRYRTMMIGKALTRPTRPTKPTVTTLTRRWKWEAVSVANCQRPIAPSFTLKLQRTRQPKPIGGGPFMILRVSSWLTVAVILLALALQCALVVGDADFESVRVLMTEDSSGKGGDPEEKYWHESVFIDHELDYENQRTNLTSLTQAYLSTMSDLGAETWIIHGTLMGWWWNRKASRTTDAGRTCSDCTQIMPWDSDIDVHVSEDTMHFLASYYNMTIHTVRTTHAPQGKNYMLEINPKWVDGDPEDTFNQIDGRWIDMLSGVFIDITAVRRQRKHPGRLFCKDRHEYREADLFPLRDSVFEERPVKIPYNYAELLQEEYGRVSLTRTRFAGHWFNSTSMEWQRKSKGAT
ncbi:MAG: hypothetical protein Q9212_002263 [Teloschistes hypoglaucus]